MTQTLSHTFIETLEGPRDGLYARALAKAGTAAGAEAWLLERVRVVFGEFERNEVTDVTAAMERGLERVGGGMGAGDTPMPADVWTRLAAAVQVEAARSNHSSAINPDSVLLRPDPLLAPKKSRPKNDEEYDLASPSRVMWMVGTALLVGLLATIYIVTRPPRPQATTHPAGPEIPVATQPGEDA